MATCPNGHLSSTDDYCDDCGVRIPLPPGPDTDRIHSNLARDELTVAPLDVVECPRCSAPRPQGRLRGGGRFCEGCGFDFVAEPRPTPVPRWNAVVSADHDHFALMGFEDLSFPIGRELATFPLDADRITVGRRKASSDARVDIDLSGPIADPGVSQRHAEIVRDARGGYSIVDVGSTNGTTINDDPELLGVAAPVALVDGDRVHVGAWTTITIREARPEDDSTA